ncbi:MAG: efflux transporter outer membrane subunit [Gammaproteobacteria bacterium]|nr:efflux transporter outer membrane subunit [Gammaproteobacteria bacterium]NIR85728.1 efflux transporter outer membrane subunit [Gammaproteobacteria bacterium]NIR90261.1 efflux transporter outer membrane subunit [Gammaproteobacteria bacterium]NIU06862.1 efflux transporter outer membrane subunit [Gammaproteobacteria bacterium]NIV53795.1 efflux transporter outer membrane subunit [Gammaproteobacteria bacterium]
MSSEQGVDNGAARLQDEVGRAGHVRSSRALVPAAMLLLAAGCTTVGPDFVKPEAPVAESWLEARDARLDTEAAEHRDWWQAFEDPVLDRLVQNAYRQNLPLRIAGIRILEARARLGVAVGNLFPQQQQARAGASYVTGSESNANTAAADLNFGSYDIGLDFGWEVDLWGKFRRAIQSADADLFASIADYDDLLVSLTAQVATAYVLIRTFEERLTIARENVTIQERSLKIADVRFRNGATTELDVQQARTLLRTTQSIIPPLEAGRRQAENALSILLGMPPSDLQEVLGGTGSIPSAPAEVAIGMPAELLRRRPDVRRAELQALSQSALIGVAQADLYPSFVLLGSIGFEAASGTSTTKSGNAGLDELFTGDSLAFVGGPRVTWNIFNYGRIKNNVRVQDARFQQLMVSYQNTVLQAAQEVEDATVAFLRSQEQAAFLADSAVAARRSVDLALIQYRDGATDYTRVLQTQQALASQQDQLTATRGDIARNLIAMYRALGGGWQLREGQDFVPEGTKAMMRERTDWGGLLAPAALDVPPPEEPQPLFRRPDF